MDSEVKLLLDRADNELLAARSLKKLSENEQLKKEMTVPPGITFYSAVISHSYYSIFYSARAALLSAGIRVFAPSIHKKAYVAFKKTFVDSGKLNARMLDAYEKSIKRKVVKAILSKINIALPKEKKEEIDKDFLRKKYHTFNNDVDEKVYRIIGEAFSGLKTIEIKYFDMESAEFSKRKLDVYYKSKKYAIGYCHLRKEIRNFRTSRIASAELTNESYQIPADFDKNGY